MPPPKGVRSDGALRGDKSSFELEFLFGDGRSCDDLRLRRRTRLRDALGGVVGSGGESGTTNESASGGASSIALASIESGTTALDTDAPLVGAAELAQPLRVCEPSAA